MSLAKVIKGSVHITNLNVGDERRLRIYGPLAVLRLSTLISVNKNKKE